MSGWSPNHLITKSLTETQEGKTILSSQKRQVTDLPASTGDGEQE